MGFKVTNVTKTDNSTKSEVSYEELNKYVVEAAGLQERETIIGYISGIVDLGNQNQPDAEVVFNGSEEDESKEIEKNPNTYFKDGFDPVSKKPVRLRCWAQKPVQCVTFSVDFPDIIVDKGQFFGKSMPAPLRVYYGGQFYTQGSGMVVGRPTPLKINKSTGEWSFDKKHLLHKMAVASKLIKPDDVFLPDSIDKLLGKSFQWEVQIFMKQVKDKQYYTEFVKYLGGLGRSQSACEPENEPFLIEFDGDLTPEKMQNLRSHVINTIKQANNYEGSKIQEYLENGSSSKPAEQSTKKETPAKVSKPSKVVVDEDDGTECPF